MDADLPVWRNRRGKAMTTRTPEQQAALQHLFRQSAAYQETFDRFFDARWGDMLLSLDHFILALENAATLTQDAYYRDEANTARSFWHRAQATACILRLARDQAGMLEARDKSMQERERNCQEFDSELHQLKNTAEVLIRALQERLASLPSTTVLP